MDFQPGIMTSCVHSDRPIHVKLLTKGKHEDDGENRYHAFPGGKPVWGNCHFHFHRDFRDYDWLVVNEDLPCMGRELYEEILACPRAHTLFSTNEPSSIKVYGHRFMQQFGRILTSQEPWVVRHSGHVYRQPGLNWHYGRGDGRGYYDNLTTNVPHNKSKVISTVTSNKQQRHTLHHQRYRFVQRLKQLYPELDFFGRGIRPIEVKADALDSYKYHLAIENYFGDHHWTEKLSDSFLGACMPIYYGCPNAEEYFPPESFIRIDIKNPEAAAEIIRKAVVDQTYEKNLPAILESRRLVLQEYGPYSEIVRIINRYHNPTLMPAAKPERIANRYLIRRGLRGVLEYVSESAYVSLRHKLARSHSRQASA